MKYAREIIELMSAYPGREFEMRELVRYVSPEAIPKERHSIRRAVLRVMESLVGAGTVLTRSASTSGSRAAYWWRVQT
jgi:hypothetical protein